MPPPGINDRIDSIVNEVIPIVVIVFGYIKVSIYLCCGEVYRYRGFVFRRVREIVDISQSVETGYLDEVHPVVERYFVAYDAPSCRVFGWVDAFGGTPVPVGDEQVYRSAPGDAVYQHHMST